MRKSHLPGRPGGRFLRDRRHLRRRRRRAGPTHPARGQPDERSRDLRPRGAPLGAPRVRRPRGHRLRRPIPARARRRALPCPTRPGRSPPLPEAPETAPGDLYLLGDHRLLCADARDQDSYTPLLEAERAALLWTDPPYGISYQGKTTAALRIENDGAGGLEALLSDSFAAADSVLSPGARLYVAHPAGELSLVFGNTFVAQGWRLRQTIVWVKDQFVLGRSDYHYRHEPIIYGHKPGTGRIGRGARGWYGDHAQDSLLEVARPRQSSEHPTMKPPELVERCLSNSTRRGDLVLDPFAGSGRRSWRVSPRAGRRGSSSSTPATAR